MFKKLENSRPFLKMAFEGFAGDGKTYTATQVAIGLHKKIKSKKPIAFFDTEMAAKALLPQFQENGIECMVVDDQRSLSALNQAIRWCEDGGADILIIDSITHVWEEVLRAYMEQKRRTRLEFQDWSVLKPKWKNEFSTPFVKAKCHIIFTGRAGYEYSDEKNEETGKREIFKSGIKMKAETETAFEPDILVLIEKQMDILGDRKRVTRDATVIKDRTATIDGKTFSNPTYSDFEPAIDRLLNGISRESHEAAIHDRFEQTSDEWPKIKAERMTLIAEIDGQAKLLGLGTGAKDQQVKAACLNKLFKVTSLESLERIQNQTLEVGLEKYRAAVIDYMAYVNECTETEQQPDIKMLGNYLDLQVKSLKELAEIASDL